MIRIGVLLLFGATLGACAATSSKPEGRPNVVIYLSNRSATRATIDIRVTVDGRQVASGDFRAGEAGGIGYTGFRYPVTLAPGSHELRVESKAGGAHLEKKIEIAGGQNYAVALTYVEVPGQKPGEESTPRFTLQMKAEPIYFSSSKGD